MLLFSFLLFFFCESTVSFLTTQEQVSILYTYLETTAVTVEENLSPLQLVATPDYPVAEGQRVTMHCSAFTMPASVSWSWQRLENQTWQQVATGRDLTLTEPEQSGLYRCHAESRLSQTSMSPTHNVYIISIRATVGEKLGIAAFILSLLALIINLAILFWLSWQRFSGMLTASNTAAKGLSGAEKPPKGCLPQTDGDVYMNYVNTNQAYSDLDPAKMTGDNVYASLS
ncbi:uncharacterized protein LOC121880950 [Thunnus maccoyii]|uniref:uncharacterized protein LOC121880950 n=1 Tax=Thunnus maccoyii TaxID=8240 RepID=UPI001C4CB915|nr:uncharacterized protein LOC121880950 [Thunnus maccoyii]